MHTILSLTVLASSFYEYDCLHTLAGFENTRHSARQYVNSHACSTNVYHEIIRTKCPTEGGKRFCILNNFSQLLCCKSADEVNRPAVVGPASQPRKERPRADDINCFTAIDVFPALCHTQLCIKP